MAPGRPKKPPILAENIKVFIQNRGFFGQILPLFRAKLSIDAFKKGVSPRIWAVFSDFYQSREQNRGGYPPARPHPGGAKVSIHRGSWHVLVALLTEFAKKRLFCSDFGLIVRKFCVLYGKKIPQFWPKTSKFSFKIRGVFLVEFCPKSGKIVKSGLKKASFFEKNVFFFKKWPLAGQKNPRF